MIVWVFNLFFFFKLIIFFFFVGSGFLDLGFEILGFDVCFVNEFYKLFLDVYKYLREYMGLFKLKYGYYLGSIDDFVIGEKK